MRSLLALIGLGALLLVGWQFRDRIPGPWNREEAAPTQVSPEAAASADAKLERLRTNGETIRLSDVEFTSYLRYRYRDALAGQLDSATVDFAGDTVTLAGRFPTDRLPETREVRAMRDFLPDTADVKLRGSLRTVQPGTAAVKVDVLSFARVAIPRSVYPDLLRKAGRRDAPGLGPDEYAFPLPPGVGTARVENSELVLAPPGA